MMSQPQPPDQKSIALDALTYLKPADRKDVLKQAGLLPDPDATTVNLIWRVIVGAFVLALLGAVAVLAYNAVAQKPTAEVLVTIFTTAVGFLAGLLTPSPAQNRQAIP